MQNAVSGEFDIATVGPELSGQLRNQRRLAGAVRTDNRMDQAFFHVQADLVGGDNAAKMLA